VGGWVGVASSVVWWWVWVWVWVWAWVVGVGMHAWIEECVECVTVLGWGCMLYG